MAQAVKFLPSMYELWIELLIYGFSPGSDPAVVGIWKVKQ